MYLVVIDNQPDSRAALLARVQEALRQVDTKRLDIIALELNQIESFDWSTASGTLIGPGCYSEIDEIVRRVRFSNSSGFTGVVLENEVYASHAVELRKRLDVNIMALGDLVQIAGFVMDSDARSTTLNSAAHEGGIIGVSQLKGGVGTTTITAALASCWARHGLSVAAIDLDDVNPQLTSWARVGVVQRTVTAELFRQGKVPANRINELVHPVEGFEGRLVAVGQPEGYNESFHFKANVLESAPSASEFMQSLISNLREEFDAVVIDLGRSWGVSTFASLPLCEHLLLITDDDGMSVRRTLDAFARLRSESDDPDEFNLSKWSLILNGYTGQLITPKEIAQEIQNMELFSPDSNLYTIPFSETGRQWGAPGQSFYDTADAATRKVVRKVAYGLIPFRYDPEESVGGKILKRWQSIVSA